MKYAIQYIAASKTPQMYWMYWCGRQSSGGRQLTSSGSRIIPGVLSVLFLLLEPERSQVVFPPCQSSAQQTQGLPCARGRLQDGVGVLVGTLEGIIGKNYKSLVARVDSQFMRTGVPAVRLV